LTRHVRVGVEHKSSLGERKTNSRVEGSFD
jgi:hypothetical protein